MNAAMRMFSIWNYATRAFDYYKAGPHQGTHVTQPAAHPLLGSALGLTPDEFAARLPAGAVRSGSGPVAMGQVASHGEPGAARTWIVYGVLAYIAWRLFR